MTEQPRVVSIPPALAELNRAYIALVLLKRGHRLADIALVLPNGARDSEPGVSAKSAEIIVRQGARALLTSVLLDRPSPGLPPELWPPRVVRAAILEARSRSRRQMLARLREWLTGGPDPLPEGPGPAA